MGKAELVAAYENARQTFLDAIDGLEDDDYLAVGAVGIWSIKDVLAHLTAWESELITALVHVENKKKGAPNIIKIDEIDEWNAERYHESASRGLQVIWDDFMGIPKHLIQAINALDDNTLDDNRKFPWMEGEPLSYVVYENAIWHEQEHADNIIHWREEVLGR